jgi:hypothetical protein
MATAVSHSKFPHLGESFMTPVVRNGYQNARRNYRGVSIIPVASKLLSSISLRRPAKTRKEQVREEYTGFRAGRGCVDQMFTLRQLLQHQHVYPRPTFVLFVDIGAALNYVDRAALWQCLVRFGMPEEYVSMLKALKSQTSG